MALVNLAISVRSPNHQIKITVNISAYTVFETGAKKKDYICTRIVDCFQTKG